MPSVRLPRLYHKTPKKAMLNILCNSRTNEIKELLSFGKEIKLFLQIL